MWMSSEDARSDFILAAAALFFGGLLVGIVTGLPFYPGGIVALLLLPVWILLVSAYPAWWLVRYREQGSTGHGLPPSSRGSLGQGVVLAVPLLAGGYLLALGPRGPVGALLGRAGDLVQGPTVEGLSPTLLAVNVVLLAAAAVSAVLLYGMLAARARDAFRSPDMRLLEGLRTFGMGAAGVALVMGLLMMLAGRRSLLGVGIDVVTLVAVVLLTDRMVDGKDTTTRATLLAPAIVVVVASLLASGGLFRGDLLGTLYYGALGGGLAIVVAALVETRRSAWAVVPLVVASVWAPTCVTLPTLVRLC